MKRRIILSFIGTMLVTASSSQAVTFAFTGLNSGDSLVPYANGTGPGYDNWYQSEQNYGTNYPIAYGQSVGTPAVNGVAVGGWFATPNADLFYIQHTVDLTVVNSQLSMTFTVGRDSGVDPDIQNSFEIGAYTVGGSNLFSLVLGQTIDPSIWSVSYRSSVASTYNATNYSANTNIVINSTLAMPLDQITSMSLGFLQNGSDVDFSLNLVSGLGEPLLPGPATGTLTGLAGANFDWLRVSMFKIPGSDPVGDPFNAYGTNYIAFSGAELVPEPSALMLLGLTAGVAALRRRRA